jgi:hypothetical protein
MAKTEEKKVSTEQKKVSTTEEKIEIQNFKNSLEGRKEISELYNQRLNFLKKAQNERTK